MCLLLKKQKYGVWLVFVFVRVCVLGEFFSVCSHVERASVCAILFMVTT